MTLTIEIIEERHDQRGHIYRAISGDQQAEGSTPGRALDSLEQLLVQQPHNAPSALIIVQRFAPDRFFNQDQQLRLEELMHRSQMAVNSGYALPADEQRELEELVNEELHATIARSANILQQLQSPDQQAA